MSGQTPSFTKDDSILSKKESLCLLPTPLMTLKSTEDMPHVYLKRDDMTGRGGGGNKLRKLEYLIQHAKDSKADTLITCGGIQSNHCRLTAAAGAAVSMPVHLIQNENVPDQPDLYHSTGNQVLNELFNASVHRFPYGTDRAAEMRKLADSLRTQGKNPYMIPLGGSSAHGCLGYVNCAYELFDQQPLLDTVVCAASSHGTLAGLLAGYCLLNDNKTQVLGCDIEGMILNDARQTVTALVRETLVLLGVDPDRFDSSNVKLLAGYGGNGYGLPTTESTEAVKRLARTEGILLDPVYTGKAFATFWGLLSRDPVVTGDVPPLTSSNYVAFIHTGGSPALMAYPSQHPAPAKKL